MLLSGLVLLGWVDLSVLELVDVLEAGALFALLLVFFVELAVEELSVGSPLTNVYIAVSGHLVFELLLAASAHGNVELTFGPRKQALRLDGPLRLLFRW